jgi:glycosyltransferase involved in cell wall biosynthesis
LPLNASGRKPFASTIWLWAAKAFGLYRGVVWQASSEHEETDIRRWFWNDVLVVVAPDLPPMVHSSDEFPPKSDKIEGCLKIVFLSRISRMENLDGALKMLKGLKGQVQFNIYVPMEDKVYWAECQKIITGLPENIEVLRQCGAWKGCCGNEMA